MKKKFLIPMVLLLGLSVVSSCGESADIKSDSTPSVESKPSAESSSGSESSSAIESTSSSSTSSETHTHKYSTTWSSDG